MKLMAGRQYKNDLSDIVGVLNGDNLADVLKSVKAKKVTMLGNQ